MTRKIEERKLLLASPDEELFVRLQSRLRSARWELSQVSGGAAALACLEEQHVEALIIDHWLPDLEVSSLISYVRQLHPAVGVFRMDGSGDSAGFLDATRDEVLQAIREVTPVTSNATRVRALPQKNELNFDTKSHDDLPAPFEERAVREIVEGNGDVELIPGLIGTSSPMRELAYLIRVVSAHSVRVLIEGETGTGKEVIANAIHALSRRASKPFVVLNCAAIPEALLEAELFGHTRGAFTGAIQSRIGRIQAADGGTLFLDEIGEMPLSLQAKLLRFLENGELQRVGGNETIKVDVRVLAATHRNLDKCVENATFRLDLLHRLAVFPIEVPSLRERLEDLPRLAEHLLAKVTEGSARKVLSSEALKLLGAHDWPGNVRELGHVLQRAVILTEEGSVIPAANIRMRRSKRF